MGWALFGHRTLGTYASDVLGLSLSTVEHLMTLAKRVERYSALGAAIEGGRIGIVAAQMIGRLLADGSVGSHGVDEGVVDRWIARAACRTGKHLREEVDAVWMAVQLDGSVDRSPPTAEDLEAVFQFERNVQSGAIARPYLMASHVPQTSIALQTVEDAPLGSERSRRPMTIRISVDLWSDWKAIEHAFHRTAGEQSSFVRFLVLNLFETWLPFLESWEDPWKDTYQRDRNT